MLRIISNDYFSLLNYEFVDITCGEFINCFISLRRLCLYFMSFIVLFIKPCVDTFMLLLPLVDYNYFYSFNNLSTFTSYPIIASNIFNLFLKFILSFSTYCFINTYYFDNFSVIFISSSLILHS